MQFSSTTEHSINNQIQYVTAFDTARKKHKVVDN